MHQTSIMSHCPRDMQEIRHKKAKLRSRSSDVIGFFFLSRICIALCKSSIWIFANPNKYLFGDDISFRYGPA